MESFGDPIVCATHSHQLSASFHKNVLGNGSGGEETFNASTSVLRLKKLSRAELSQIFVFSKIVRHLINACYIWDYGVGLFFTDCVDEREILK